MRIPRRLPTIDRIQAAQRVPLVQVAKTAVATVGAWLVAGWLIPGPLPVFAAIAALLVVQPSVNQSFGKALERSFGVTIGVIIASIIAIVFGDFAWVILVTIVIAIFAAWALKMTATTSNQVAISAMLVLALGASSPEYAVDRVLETLIGAAIGLIINAAIVPPVLVKPARRDVGLLGEEIAACLDRLADALVTPQSAADLNALLIEARLLRPMADAAGRSIDEGYDSLTFNPRRSAHRSELDSYRALLARFYPMLTQIAGMTRAVTDHWNDSLIVEPQVHAIGEQLRRAAHDTRLLIRPAVDEPEPMTSEIPALTSPLVVSAPKGGNWVVIGALIEDLRRIHENLTDDPAV
ncbi:aromatic acid exporter family protein [Agromyces atrinae]|uniref:FUSC family protein n=1 Tax=Agromyces atrinae TaxID=592376 RepID=UPI001F570F3A|nr:FUSC family protein [Agromyces atrinae]MCI2956266.1 aromatic acid exporter family protein [Agromyces atrinae]